MRFDLRFAWTNSKAAMPHYYVNGHCFGELRSAEDGPYCSSSQHYLDPCLDSDSFNQPLAPPVNQPSPFDSALLPIWTARPEISHGLGEASLQVRPLPCSSKTIPALAVTTLLSTEN